MLNNLFHALYMSFAMFWEVAWSLVLGFTISAAIQVLVSKEKLQSMLGGDGLRQIALATGLGAASSSCSYASASVTRTLFQKGAGLITSLAFLFASTNLVIELGLILLLLMGWQFMVAEWIGGIVLIVIMSILVRVTYPHKLVEEARQHAKMTTGDHDHATHEKNIVIPSKIQAIAQHFVIDLGMLWKDLAVGFLIAGFLGIYVPHNFWQTLFITNAPTTVQVPLNAFIGPLIAVISFVCSIGNVPMAAILWNSGISFGGVLAFLYADLIVLPLLDTYRRYLGWKMATYIGVLFYFTMALSGIIMDVIFTIAGLVPPAPTQVTIPVEHAQIGLNYSFWLNLAFGGLALYFIYQSRKAPAHQPSCCSHHNH